MYRFSGGLGIHGFRFIYQWTGWEGIESTR
jgi:hypothetical protein